MSSSGEIHLSAITAFVLLGERGANTYLMVRDAGGGTTEAIRALLDLAPPMVTVISDGEALRLAAAEAQVGELVGRERRVDGVIEDRRERPRQIIIGRELHWPDCLARPVLSAGGVATDI